MAQDSQTRIISDLEAEEIALAEEHNRILVVDPESPEAQVNPPGLDNELLIEKDKQMEMMQAEINKLKMENSKLKSLYTDDQQEPPPE